VRQFRPAVMMTQQVCRPHVRQLIARRHVMEPTECVIDVGIGSAGPMVDVSGRLGRSAAGFLQAVFDRFLDVDDPITVFLAAVKEIHPIALAAIRDAGRIRTAAHHGPIIIASTSHSVDRCLRLLSLPAVIPIVLPSSS
jgi:hypothetical protein